MHEIPYIWKHKQRISSNKQNNINKRKHSHTQTSPNKQPYRVPWWNKNLSLLRKTKQQAWKILNNNITTENIINYRRANAKLKFEIKKRKQETTNSFTSTIQPSTPSSQIWTNIRRFCGLNPIRQIHALSNPYTRQTTTNNYEIANILAQHWSDLAKDSNFTQKFRNNKYKTNNLNYQPSLTAQEIEKNITKLELLSALQTLKGSTPGLNRISYQMIKHSSLTTKNRITNLFNQIRNNYIPQSYKNSLIIPIPKPNTDKTEPTSYRPISLNCCLSKTLDKIIAKRLWWFVTHNKFLNPNQFGFKKGKSTSDSLLYVDYLIMKSRKHTSLITLDFSRAFDRVGVHTIVGLSPTTNF